MAVQLKKYDFPQVLRSVFEEDENCLRVRVVNGTPGGGGELEVLITHTEDSVRLGDGTDFITSTHVGSKVGYDVAVINNPDVKLSNTLVKEPFDYIQAAYPTSTQEVYTYKFGGVGGTLVATVTVNYTDITKNYITTVEVS